MTLFGSKNIYFLCPTISHGINPTGLTLYGYEIIAFVRQVAQWGMEFVIKRGVIATCVEKGLLLHMVAPN